MYKPMDQSRKEITMKPIKLGIIGCGIAAKDLHWPALSRMREKFEIVMVCNHTAEKAKEFSQMAGNIPYVLDYKELLGNKDIEAVDIILPIHLNYQVTRDALEAGKHVMVEKPLAANLEEAKQMLELERKYKEVVMVAENFRYHPIFLKTKEYLDQGKIGDPYAVFWNHFCHLRMDNKYAKTLWRLNHQYPGGFITDGGVHNIAVFRDLFGDIISGISSTKSVNRTIGEIDSMSFQFTTEKNVNGVFNTYYSANGYSENRILILGKEGTIIIQGDRIQIKREGFPDVEETIESDWGYRGEFEDFYHAIRSGRKVVSSFFEAYRDLEVMIAALDSAEQWKHFTFKKE
ncbi:MAG: Gfo/Idh/MocA family oxidoreductase [Clostridia bacterium]|nr:Gfo/Idh/MocA family oxidoreductase [Clostridia bacterium]